MEANMAAHPQRIKIGSGDRPVLEKWANARAIERRVGRSCTDRADGR